MSIKILTMDKDTLQERKKEMFKIMEYSIQRIDLLIISISGAGVYLCLETLKFMYSNKLSTHWAIKVSAAFFLLAIIVNFVSQFLSFESSKLDYESTILQLKENITEEDSLSSDENLSKSEKFGKCVDITNIASAVCMMIGLVICFFYFISTF